MKLLSRLLLAGLCALFAHAASADQIKLLATVGYKPVLVDLLRSYEKQSRNRVLVDYDSPAGLARRIGRGETFDLVIMSEDGLEKMLGDRKIVDDSITPLAKAGIGVAIQTNAKQPDLSSIEGFRRTLLAARAVAYTSPNVGGVFYSQLFQRLGILSEIERKSVPVVGGYAAQKVAGNQADIALAPASEIIVVPGARYAGPIPEVLQSYTTYSAAIGLRAKDSDAVTDLMSWLSSGELEPLLRARGMELP